MSKIRKVYLLQEIIPSYRVPVFRRLAKIDGIDLTVFHSEPSHAMLSENLRSANKIDGFQQVKLRRVEIGENVYQLGIILEVVRNRPDVVIAGQAGRLDLLALALLCRLLGIRMLWFQGGVPYIDEARIHEYADRGRMNRWFGRYNPRRFLTLMTDGLIAYSRHAKIYYHRMGFPADKIWVAPNSPDTVALESYRDQWLEKQECITADKNRYAPQGEKIVLLIGRLNKGRKVDTLLSALRRLNQAGAKFSLIIVGDGAERERLELAVRDYGLPNVYFAGAIYDERELSRYFMIADIFVTPGVASLALKMAMLFGKPVVTVDFGLEVHDVQDRVNGLIFPMDDDQALAECLQRLIDSDEMAREMGENGRRLIGDEINIRTMIGGFRRAIFDEPDIDARASGTVGDK